MRIGQTPKEMAGNENLPAKIQIRIGAFDY